MRAAFSFCPNDTFLFAAWVLGFLETPVEAYLGDIIELNNWALSGSYPLIKISVAHYPLIENDYQLLPVGAALGFGVGPKIICKPENVSKSLQTIAIPGASTTAHALWNHFFPSPIQKMFYRYDKIIEAVTTGLCDAGLVIHESRFNFQSQGLASYGDLGQLWEAHYHLPLPLGALAIRRDYSDKYLIGSFLQRSLKWARACPERVMPYVIKHSQQKDVSLILQHLDAYVNDQTLQLDSTGIQAISTFLNRSPEKWLAYDPATVCTSL